jgi:hypothetical protein
MQVSRIVVLRAGPAIVLAAFRVASSLLTSSAARLPWHA